MNPEWRPISFTNPTPPGARARLDVRGADRLSRLRERRAKTETVIDERDVVVNRLRHPHDRDPQLALCDHASDRLGAMQRAVAADHDQDVGPELLQAIDDLLGILPAARTAEDRAAVLVDAAHQ